MNNHPHPQSRSRTRSSCSASPRSRFCARSFSSESIRRSFSSESIRRSFSSELLGLLLCAALSASAANLVPEDKRDAQVPFQGAGKMGMVYTPCFFPKDTEAVLFTCEVKTEGVEAGAQKWFDARILTDYVDSSCKKVKGGPAIGGWTGTRDWTPVRKAFEVPAGVAGLALMPALFNVKAGAFEVRNLSLEPITAVEAALDGVPRSETLPIRPEWTTAPLQARGNRLVDAKTGKEVWLQGAAVPSLEWGPGGDHILESVTNLVEKWNVNVVRLAVHSSYWFGRGKWQNPKTGVASYRGLVDQVADYLQRRGKYLVLDLHEYRAAKPHHAAFWLDASTRYKNHPGVIFGLLNEPHDISWEVWRNGGLTTEQGTGSAPAENAEKLAAERTIGMQGLVDAVRRPRLGVHARRRPERLRARRRQPHVRITLLPVEEGLEEGVPRRRGEVSGPAGRSGRAGQAHAVGEREELRPAGAVGAGHAGDHPGEAPQLDRLELPPQVQPVPAPELGLRAHALLGRPRPTRSRRRALPNSGTSPLVVRPLDP